MRHFFILGSNPVLSAAEIIALLPGRDFTVTELYKHALIVQAAPAATLDVPALMARLGGTIKIGHLLDGEFPLAAAEIERIMTEGLAHRIAEGGATYGLSVYSLLPMKAETHAAKVAVAFRKVGMEVKRHLRESGCSARWVRPQTGAALTSVAVAKNRILTEGAEFIALAKEDSMLVGTTAVVQPFEEFSRVDYGRPNRDMVQGMLPPKLARMMINLVHVSKESTDITLHDPFCGSGTVLTEAMRLGFRAVSGSDINPAAIEATKRNIAWVREQGMTREGNVSADAFVVDARELGSRVAPGSVDAIVTEAYLGPPMSGNESRGEMQKRLAELTKLYVAALRAWKPVLAKDAPVVMALPVYIHGIERHGVDATAFAEAGFRTESLLPAPMLARMGVKETRNKGLLYGRNDQRVWREIVRMRAV